MITSDAHSLLFLLAIVKLIQAFLLVQIMLRVDKLKGIDYWVYGSLSTGIGVLISAFCPYPVSPMVGFMYSLLHNLFLIVGECAFFAGFQKFIGNPIKKGVLFGFPLLAVVNVITFSLIFNVVWMRLFVNSLLLFALYVMIAMELKQQYKLLRLPSIWKSVLYCLFAYSVLNLVRSVFYIIYRPTNPVDSSTTIVVLLSLIAVCTLLMTYELILVIMITLSERLAQEIKFMNKLYAIIAHDLRNPFESFVNYVGVLKQSYNTWDGDQMKSWIYDMENMSLNSRFLVENLLNWSERQLKQIRKSPSKYNMGEMIDNAITKVQHLAAHKNIQMRVSQQADSIAYFDAEMIGFVIQSLCVNVMKTMALYGILQITICKRVNKIEVSICDDCVGGHKEIGKRIDFDTFDSICSEDSDINSGFGLLLSKEFVELNGGEITAYNIAATGYCFTFTLPAAVVD